MKNRERFNCSRFFIFLSAHCGRKVAAAPVLFFQESNHLFFIAVMVFISKHGVDSSTHFDQVLSAEFPFCLRLLCAELSERPDCDNMQSNQEGKAAVAARISCMAVKQKAGHHAALRRSAIRLRDRDEA